ncbi:MAG: hypothetical protein JRE40_13915 [Deltaproteobacteria bacterium]|nr:hypothetical protein [Deltaproteobacteria bacterium]
MPKRDLHSNIKVVQHVAAVAITATNTPGSGVDNRDYDSMEFVFSVGIMTNVANSPQPSFTFKLQDSTAVSSLFADVTDSNLVLTGSAQSPSTTPDSSTGVFLTIDAASEDAATYRVGYIGGKRYVRLVATAANTPGSTPYSAVCILSHAQLAPTAD